MMDHSWAERAAEKYLEKKDILSLPVDPIKIAESHGIMVQAKPASNAGVSGMLIKAGDQFGIAYATHIDVEGFQRFSIAHELGHYLLPGHPESLFPEENGIHESRAGFVSADKYERQADHFAAGLLMPRGLFTKEIDKRLSGFQAINELAELCKTSLTSTAIRYSKFTSEPMAVVLSEDARIDWCFISDELNEIGRIDWPKKGQGLPRDSVTFDFNENQENITNCNNEAGDSSFAEWFGGDLDFEIEEESIGLGNYGKTLTVLTVSEDIEALKEEGELEDSWTPKFRR